MSQWVTITVAAITSAGTLGVARTARRTPRQERRDDFEKVTERLDKDIARLENRVTAQDGTIRGQATALGYLSGWVRSMALFIRVSGLEPPQPPPMPDEARPFLHDIGV